MYQKFTDVKELDTLMATATYVAGPLPTQRDISVFKAIAEPGPEFPNAARWWNHIATFSKSKMASLPGVFEVLAPTLSVPVAPTGPSPAPAKESNAPSAKGGAKASEQQGKDKSVKPAKAVPVQGSEARQPPAVAAASGSMEETLRETLDGAGSVADSLPFAAAHSFDHAALIGVCKSMESAQRIATSTLSKTMVVLSKEGEECAASGSPEARVFHLVPAGTGILQEELMNMAGSVGKVGMAKAVQSKWLEVVKEEGCVDEVGPDGKKKPAPKRVKRVATSIVDDVRSKLEAVIQSGGKEEALAKEELTALKKRNLLSIATIKSLKIEKGADFARWGQKVRRSPPAAVPSVDQLPAC